MSQKAIRILKDLISSLFGAESIRRWVWGSGCYAGLGSLEVWWNSSFSFSSTNKGILTAHLSTG